MYVLFPVNINNNSCHNNNNKNYNNNNNNSHNTHYRAQVYRPSIQSRFNFYNPNPNPNPSAKKLNLDWILGLDTYSLHNLTFVDRENKR